MWWCCLGTGGGGRGDGGCGGGGGAFLWSALLVCGALGGLVYTELVQ